MNNVARLVAVVFVQSLCADAHAATLSRTSTALRLEEGEHWNPFTAVAKAAKAAWNPVDKMRGDMCWDRENMLEHEECMEWMIKKCKAAGADDKADAKSTKKRCDKLEKYVKENCMEGSELACKYAKELGIELAVPAAPAPAPMSAPGPAPVPSGPAPAPAPKVEEAPAPAPEPPIAEKEAPAPAPAQTEDAGGTTGKPQKLQSQGFEGKGVRHRDGKTYSSDWGDEYEHPTTTATTTPKSSAWLLHGPSKVVVLIFLSSLTWAASSIA